MKKKIKPLSFSKVKTYPLKTRKNLVRVENFARPSGDKADFAEFFTSLPGILASRDLKRLVRKILDAREREKPVIWGLGAHFIKVGLNPYLIKLIEKGFVSLIALNGAGVIHDVEIALIGETSEDVGKSLQEGSFGFARETGELINGSLLKGKKEGWGFGQAVMNGLKETNPPFASFSLLWFASQKGIPVTVHVAIGTDIIHTHPSVDGEALGKASLIDFQIFCGAVKELNEGGVYLNIGSAVLLPEVFLKALTVARNLGFRVEKFTTASFDFQLQYRPRQNVVARPTAEKGSEGYYFLGHHEFLIPLLAQALIEELG